MEKLGLVFVGLLMAGAAVAQQRHKPHDYAKDWNSRSPEWRLAWEIGFTDGYAEMGSETGFCGLSPKNRAKLKDWIATCTAAVNCSFLGDAVVAGMTLLYSDPANSQLPFSVADGIAKMELLPGGVEDEIRKQRALYAK